MEIPTLISLTDKGQKLAKRLSKQLKTSDHLHCPKPFSDKVQQAFLDKSPLIFITATGIAVRTLAPVIQNKMQDPPVLVIDQDGKFVIPLLSGHEGGANRWAIEISDILQAQAVITTANTYTEPSIVVGMGSDRGCPIELLQTLLESTLAKANRDSTAIAAICSIDLKQDELGLIELSQKLAIPFICYGTKALRGVEDQLTQKSEIVFQEVGVYGVAEAAALVYAHEHNNHSLISSPPTLIVPKQKNKRATCAIATF